ncbi:UvrD-like helicase, ATP-binding domain, P-loop containing nucleoside triphosphate hydrolase [Tanacetum coccineum]
MATMCYDRACAGQIPGRDLSYLKEAAQMFESTGKLEYAASCYCDLGEFERAGKFYADKCGKIDAAAECFTLAGCYSEAAEAYAKLDQFSNYISKEIEQVDQEYWESGARGYHERKDPILMMKFVRAFCSMESKHVFLRSLGYLDDLLSLEEEAGHFLEVAELARSWGDLLKEADLFKEATFLLLRYDFLNSLWGTGNIGWPLKQIDQKEELCNKLKSLAKKDTYILYDFVCSELKVLCDCYNLSELKSGLDLSQKNRSLRGEILLIRKIIEYYILPYYKFLKIHTDAGWIKNYGQKGLHKDGKRVTIDEKELVYAIKSYWQSELLSVGEKVLNTLEVLHKTKSKGSAFHQSTTLLHIFEVSKFLLDCEYHVLTLPYKKNLQRFLDISLSYFDIVFPLDWRNATSQDLISLRKTDLSVSLIHEIINQINCYIKDGSRFLKKDFGIVVLQRLLCLPQTLHNALEDTCLQVNCSQYLLELLMGRNKILYLLPQKFVSNLLRRRNSGGLNLNFEVVAEAFASVEDPLLIVGSGKTCADIVLCLWTLQNQKRR